MGTVEAYEHRGARYKSLKIETEAELREALLLFHEEQDVWLKKLLAEKLYNQDVLKLSDSDRAQILEATKCRID